MSLGLRGGNKRQLRNRASIILRRSYSLIAPNGDREISRHELEGGLGVSWMVQKHIKV